MIPEPSQSEQKEPKVGSDRIYHLELLAVSALALVLSFLLVRQPGGRVALMGFDRFLAPEVCMPNALFGIECPGCGLTRSFICLSEGDWRRAWELNRVGWVLYGLAWFQIPYRVLALFRPNRLRVPPRISRTVGIAIILALMINWLWNTFIESPNPWVDGLPRLLESS